jgi:hypothetical protein
VRLAPDEHLVLVTIHHIVSDAWSMGVLTMEVAELYEAFSQGRPSPLAEPALQYADYAVWQRGWLHGEVLQAQLDYWTERLRGVPRLALPTDRTPPARPSGRGGVVKSVLPVALLDKLRALSREEKATLYMTMMAAYQALLYRYTGQDDFAVGSPIAGRTRSEISSVIGFFVNTLVIRADVSGNPDFRSLLRRVRAAALGAYAHQDLPYEKLVAVLQAERDHSRAPLFQTLFAVQNAPLPGLEAPEMAMTVFEPDSGTAKFDLALFATEEAAGLELQFQYSLDLFDAATVEQWLTHYRTLLEGIVARPDQPVGTLALLAATTASADATTPPGMDVDGLTDDEVEALLQRLESGIDA